LSVRAFALFGSALLGIALTGAAAAAGPAPTPVAVAKAAIERRIAITIDDLPWASLGEETPPTLAEYHPRLMAALAAEKAPVIGFVNEGKLLAGGKVETARVHLLRDWLAAGADLGNHTQDHGDLHAIGLEEYESQVLRGETFLRPLLAEKGRKPQWFRHPYLRTGRTPEDKAALGAFLGEHGYRIAPVTVDTSDWLWAAAYRKAIAADDAASMAKLREGYVPYMLAKVDYFEAQSIALLGYNLPQVLLMHANELNADAYGELLDGLRKRGYAFIDLESALQDPAYQRADAYTGRWGPSWIHRWAIGENKPKEFFAGEPVVPQWVKDYAGIQSE
jgi:peptidoglycan/xylan/chitin deacetylase (PgdA/CDA1 family)